MILFTTAKGFLNLFCVKKASFQLIKNLLNDAKYNILYYI